MTFLCDYLRMMTLGSENPHEMESLMDEEIETHQGEFVCILAGVGEDSPLLSAGEVLGVLLEELPPSRAARVAARLTGADRAELYRQAVTLTR